MGWLMLRRTLIVVLTLLFSTNMAYAVEQMTLDGMSKEKVLQFYQSGKQETVKGTVLDVNTTQLPGKEIKLVHLTLQTDKGPVKVRLGPEKFLDKSNLKINKGDAIEVTGSNITVGNRSVVIAAEVNKGGTIVKLRDKATGALLIPGMEDK